MYRIIFYIPFLFLFLSCGDQKKITNLNETEEIKTIEAELTDAPNVPPPITRKHAAKVIVRLEVREVQKELTDGVKYTFWTFGGNVPGKFIRIREGDIVEFHLRNHPDNKNPHNIDLHAVTGPGGGATASFTAPGHETVFNFRAINPGLFVYHCATAPVGMHIANGMYGLILVEPKEGLPEVDREFYVMQGEFYTAGKYGAPGLQPFDMGKALNERPDYVVFNGNVSALTGENAIQANVGERVRFFIGNGGPNLVSSFHLIGEIFDKVYTEGGTSTIQENVQTTLVPAGGATMVELKLETTGTYILVDHSIFRAFNKGALGMLKVSGNENKGIFTGQTYEGIYLPEGSTIQEMPKAEAPAAPEASSKEERMTLGGRIYTQTCQACHQPEGKGIPGAFPPLRNSDYIQSDVNKAIKAATFGLEGSIKVNGESFNSVMPKLNLTDEQIANVLTYVLNHFENQGGEVTPEQVKRIRDQGEH